MFRSAKAVEFVRSASFTQLGVDLITVTEIGWPDSSQDIVAFLLSPEARQLRPLLLGELVDGADLLVRDQLRRAYARLPALAPRLPLLGALPTLPPPPVLVPGRGFMSMGQVVEAVAPELDRSEEVYLQSVLQLIASVSGTPLPPPSVLTEPCCCCRAAARDLFY